MDSVTHFHSRNVYFYIHYSNSLKVTALDMFKKNLGSHPLKHQRHTLHFHFIDIEYNKRLDRQRPCLEDELNGGSNYSTK